MRTSIHDEYPCSTKITTHLDRISHCNTTFDTSLTNRSTHRFFIINTRRDSIREAPALFTGL